MGAQVRFPGEPGQGARNPKGISALVVIAIWVFLATALLAQTQPAEDRKGFPPNATFATSGLDNVNVFNGNLLVSIPLGPNYPIGADFTHQLRLIYNAKPWRSEWACLDANAGKDYYAVLADGSPVLGAGWSIEVGHLGPYPSDVRPYQLITLLPQLTYHSPDGGVHNFKFPPSSVSGNPQVGWSFSGSAVTDDTTYIRARLVTWDTNGVATYAELDFPDGSHGTFSQPILPSEVEHGGTPQEFHQAGLYLSRLTSRYGDYLLVTYEHYASSTRWRLSQIEHFRRDGARLRRPIDFRYDAMVTISRMSSQTPAANWTVLTGIDLPAVRDDQQYPTTDPRAKIQQIRFDYWTTGFSRPPGTALGACTSPVTVTPEVAAPLLQRVTLDTAYPALKYEFDYNKGILSPVSTSAAAMTQMGLPTGGSVDYAWDENYVYTNFDSIPIDRNCLLNPFSGADCYRLWILRSTALLHSRTEQPSNARWDYSRTRTFYTNSLGGYQVTQVTAPDGYKVNHYFAMNADPAELQVSSNGLEYQRDILDSSGRVVRRSTFCYGGDGYTDINGVQHPVPEACVSDLNFDTPGSNVRETRETVSTILPTTGAPLQTRQTARTFWDDFGHFRYESVYDWANGASPPAAPLRTTERLYGVSSANPNPAPNDSARFQGNWLLFPLLSENVAEAGKTVQTTRTYNSSNGFLLSTTADDLLMQGCSGGASCGTRTADSPFPADLSGNPATENFRSAGGGMDGRTYTKTNTFLNGQLTTSQLSGVNWKASDRTLDAATGLVVASRDQAGLTTTTGYDILGRPILVTPPGEASTLVCYDNPTQTTVSRDVAATPTCPIASTAGLTWEQYLYDSFGRLIREIRRRPDGFSVQTHHFDAVGREDQVSEWGPCSDVTACLSASPGATTSFDFDPFGRPGRIQRADLSETSIDYSDGSVLASDTQKKVTVCVNAVNAGGSCAGTPAATLYRYDGLGRLTQVTEPDSSVTMYSYNVLGKLTQVTQPGGGVTQTRSFTYDAAGFLRSETTPEKGTVQYGKYDSLGNLVESTEPNTFRLTRTYNTAGQLLSLASSEAGGRTYLSNSYDGFGRLSQSISNNFTSKQGANVVSESFAYSPTTSRLIAKTSGYPGLPANSFETDWTYTPLGLLNDMSHLAGGTLMGKVTYAYRDGYPVGVQGQPKGLGNTPLVTAASYNASGGLASFGFLNGATTTITPDGSLPRPSRIAVSGGRWDSGAYSYDAAGNIKAIGSDSYHYDPMSRIDGATIGGTSHTFAYDRWGNLTRKGPTSTPQTFAIDPNKNQIQTSSIVSYDALGNLTRYGTSSFFYDALSRQTDWSNSSGAQESYVYSAAGERVGRVGNFPPTPPPTITSDPALKMCPSQTPTYATTFQAAGGFQPYTWSAAGLLSWMSLSGSGVFTATPPASLTLPQMLSFTVTVTDGANQSVSRPFSLTVGSCPPFWIAEPQDTILCPGTAYTMGVRARDPNAPLDGPDGVTYIWQRLGSDGVTWIQVSTTVSANEIPPAAVNYYRAIATATANDSFITSRVARVSVGEPIRINRSDTAYFSCATNPPAAVDLSWFIDAIGGNLQITWQKQNTDGSWSDLPSTLVTPTQTTAYRARLSSSCAPTVYGNILSIVVFTPLTVTQTPLSQSFCPSGSVTVSEMTNAPAYVKWQRYDAATTTWVTIQDSAPQGIQKTSDSLTLTPSGTSQYKVIVSNYCGAVESSFTLTQTPLPAVAGVPANPQVCVPGATTFAATVSNAASLQWQSSANGTTWTNIIGATTATYTTPVLPTGYSYYRLAATNSCGTVYAQSLVSGNPIPHPQIAGPCSIGSGETVTLTATSDVPGSTFLWDQGLGGGASVQVHPTATTTYSCTVQTPQGCAAVAQYTVAVGTHVDPPVISGQPLPNTIVCAGLTGTLSVIATGTNLAYQWQQLSGVTWNNVGGATSSTLSVGATDAAYRVIVSNSCGSVTSNQATVTASSSTPATITSCPQSTYVCSGGSTTLSVVASGTGPLSYAWQKSTDQTNWVNLSGSTASFTDSPTVPTYYRVYVSNVCRQVVSNIALVTPVSAVTVTQQPGGSGAACGSWTMTAAASAAGVSYQWQALSGSWSNIAGATGNSYAATATGTYRCMMSNACSSVASSQAEVAIVPPPPAPSIQGSTFIYAGDVDYLSVPYDGYPNDLFSWSDGQFGPRTIAVYPTATTTYYANRYRNGCWSDWGPGFTVTVGAGGASYLGYYDAAGTKVSLAYASTDKKHAKEIPLHKKKTGTVLAGDWDGDGMASVGVYDPDTGTFSLWNGEPKGKPDYELQVAGLSGPSWQPLVGDWDGDGIDTVGLYNASTGEARLRNKNSTGAADVIYRLVLPVRNGTAVAGDWLGQGYDTLGVYDPRASVFYLKDSHKTGGADHAVAFEAWKEGLLPLAGDWNWTQMSKLGLYDPETGEVRLRITLTSGPPDYVRKVSDNAYDVQVFPGRWNAPKHSPGGKKKSSAVAVDQESRGFGGSDQLGVASSDGLTADSGGGEGGSPARTPSVSLRKEVAGLPAGLTWHYTVRDEANRPSIQYHLDPSGNLVLDRIHAYLGNLHVATYEAQTLEPQWHYYASDHLGSTRLIMDSTGATLSAPTYLPFGEQIGGDPPGVTPALKFAAMERDGASSGNDYDHARYISSVTGRFLSLDSLGGYESDPQSWNRYSYSGNSPLKFVDRNGLEKTWAQWVASAFETAGAAVSSAGAAVKGLPLGLGQGPGFALEHVGMVVSGAGDVFNLGSTGPEAAASGADVGTTVNAFATEAIRAAGIAMAVAGAAEGRATATVPEGTTLYRVWGGQSRQMGTFWTTIDPTTVANYRDAAGLPDKNAGTLLTAGRLTDSRGTSVGKATSLDGNNGGLPEVIVPNPIKQIEVTRIVILANPQ